MSAKIPPQVAETKLSRRLEKYLKLLYRGKVRDSYKLPNDPNHLLVLQQFNYAI